MERNLTVALSGNPNSGKTTIFNNLTGAHQHVGNWPGVTVEKKEGMTSYNGYDIRFVDLPGTYSLTAYSLDELIARNFVVEEKPDVVVDIVDASNLERNLYLTIQLIELQVAMVVCLNMIDVAESRGYRIDIKQLSEFLGAPVVPTVGHRNRGTKDLLEAVVNVASGKIRTKKVRVNYGDEINEEIEKLEACIQNNKSLIQKYPSHWLAAKLLEGDEEMTKKIEKEGR